MLLAAESDNVALVEWSRMVSNIQPDGIAIPNFSLAANGKFARMPATTRIAISRTGCEMDGTSFGSGIALTETLVARNIEHVHFDSDKNASYEQVKEAMKAAQDAGADVGIRGSIDP